MPPSAAETLAGIDVSTAREAPETDLCLGRVAQRLNRLAVLRASFRSLGAALLAASALAACAAWLSQEEFRIALAVLALLVLVIVALSLRALRRRWSGPLEAARWVEAKVPLDQRLLTLVSARPTDATQRLWPELVSDNRTQLPRWRDDRLGIAALPANTLLLLVALLAAWLFLVPWYEESPAPPELAGRTAAPPAQAPGAEGPGEAPAGVGTQSGFQDGTRGADEGSAPRGKIEGSAQTGALHDLQSELAQNFERSLGGSAVLQDGGGKSGDGAAPEGERPAVAESGLGKSEAEEGGLVPDEQLARREQDDGSGQTVQQEGGGEGGSAKAKPGEGKGGRQSDQNERSAKKGDAQAGGRAAPGGDAPADGPLALGNEDGKKSHAGGAGAGTGKATEALLAKKALTLDGGHHKARFSLTLGGIPSKAGSDGPKSLEAQPSSRIADAGVGPQEADRAVRHEEIPAEYEAVVKKIFKRDP